MARGVRRTAFTVRRAETRVRTPVSLHLPGLASPELHRTDVQYGVEREHGLCSPSSYHATTGRARRTASRLRAKSVVNISFHFIRSLDLPPWPLVSHIQAGQSFLPPTIGRPEANPEALGRRLLTTGAVVGAGNCTLASAVLLLAAGAFASSGSVVETVATLSPFVSAALFIHCTSMATESIMLAGRRYYYLVATYAANTGLVVLLYSAAFKAGLSQLQSVWVGIITFQLVRLLTNAVMLSSPYSVLKSKEPLKALSQP